MSDTAMKTIKAIMVEPDKTPKTTELKLSIDAFNKAVSIGTGYDCLARCKKLEKGVYLLYADESNCLFFTPNRRVGKDIITGVFYVIAEKDGVPTSLSEHQIKKHKVRFHEPEEFKENEVLDSYLNNLSKEIDEMQIPKI